MRTTRPTDDDLRVIVQTLAVSGSLGQDDGSALLREIDALSYDLEAAERDRERLRAAGEGSAATLRELWTRLSLTDTEASIRAKEAEEAWVDALAAEHRPEAVEGADGPSPTPKITRT